MIQRFAFAGFAAACALAAAAPAAAADAPMAAPRGDRIVGPQQQSRSAVIAEHGVAATAHPLASLVAVETLKKGGTAIDAAIAANAMLGLMEPVGCGIGGDLFAIVWDPKTKKLYGLNASGRAPKGRTLEDMRARIGDAKEIPPVGSAAVTVPGAVDGWFALHERFGKLPMDEILAPAISYAREGFPVPQLIAYYWGYNFERFAPVVSLMEEFDNAKATYLKDGKAPQEGDIFKNPDLAETYEMIAKGGRDAFYEGEIAKRIDAYMKRIGAPMRLSDLAGTESDWVEPLSINYRGYDVHEIPPNTQGISALQMLKILEGWDLSKMGPTDADYLHLLVEAKKIAFADRARGFTQPLKEDEIAAVISDAAIREARAKIDVRRRAPPTLSPAPKPSKRGTRPISPSPTRAA